MKKNTFLLVCLLFSYAALPQLRKSLDQDYFVGLGSILAFNYDEGIRFSDSSDPSYFNRSLFLSNALEFSLLNQARTMELGLSIRMPSIKPSSDPITNYSHFKSGINTKIYPFKLMPYQFTPFLSLELFPINYQQENEAYRQSVTQLKSSVGLGLGYLTSSTYFKMGYFRVLDPQVQFYSSKNVHHTSFFPGQFVGFSLGVKIDKFKGPANSLIRSTYVAHQYTQNGAMSLFLTLGYSEYIQVFKSDYLSTFHPYMDQFNAPRRSISLSIGNKFENVGVAVELRINRHTQERASFDTKLEVKNQVVSLEIKKDIQTGRTFVPYVGAGIGYYDIEARLIEPMESESLETQRSKFTPVVKVGYEVKRNIYGGYWTFGSILRYTPLLTTKLANESISLQQIEFSPIVITFYPGKYVMFKRLLK